MHVALSGRLPAQRGGLTGTRPELLVGPPLGTVPSERGRSARLIVGQAAARLEPALAEPAGLPVDIWEVHAHARLHGMVRRGAPPQTAFPYTSCVRLASELRTSPPHVYTTERPRSHFAGWHCPAQSLVMALPPPHHWRVTNQAVGRAAVASRDVSCCPTC